MNKHREIERKWMIAYLTPAVGCTIIEIGVGEDEEGEEGYPYLKLRRPATDRAEAEEYTLEVSQDEEGNGPGYLFGLPSPGSSVTTVKLKNGIRVLSWEDAKPKRFSRADAAKELKRVQGMGHKGKIRKAQPSGNHYIEILEGDNDEVL